jgi:hypothetical protein
VALWGACIPDSASAATRVVLGKYFAVKDSAPAGDSSPRSVVVLGREPLSDDTVVGDPLVNGATVEIIANGGTSTTQTFTLPRGASVSGLPGWKALGSPVVGYSYRDAVGANGRVRMAVLRKGANGTLLVKVTIKGSRGPITVEPPAPGTDGGMRFVIDGGDTYCVAFGGPAGGAVTNAPEGSGLEVFRIVGNPTEPTTESGCPSPPMTTSTSSSTTNTTATSTTTTTTILPVCGQFLMKWGSFGDGDGQFLYPYGIAVDPTGNVLVADGSRIQRFTGAGTFLSAWGNTDFGSYGIAAEYSDSARWRRVLGQGGAGPGSRRSATIG